MLLILSITIPVLGQAQVDGVDSLRRTAIPAKSVQSANRELQADPLNDQKEYEGGDIGVRAPCAGGELVDGCKGSAKVKPLKPDGSEFSEANQMPAYKDASGGLALNPNAIVGGGKLCIEKVPHHHSLMCGKNFYRSTQDNDLLTFGD